MKFLVIINLIALSQALSFKSNFQQQRQLVSEESIETQPISPYSFSYTAEATDGSSARQESADASGVVRGSYSVVSADGIKRIVNYIADENGFRAQVQTNEPGTESKSSADVVVQSSQLPAEEIALKYGPRPDEQPISFKGFEQKQEIHNLGQFVKSQPKTVLFNRPLVSPQTQNFIPIPNFQSIPKQIETPIKLLSRIPKIHTLKTDLKPFGFDLQKKEELSQQNFEGF